MDHVALLSRLITTLLLLSLVAYGWLGFLWLIYDTAFSINNPPLAVASKVQTVAFLSVIGAIATAIATYIFEIKNL